MQKEGWIKRGREKEKSERGEKHEYKLQVEGKEEER